MTYDQATIETLDLAITQLRRAANLLKSRDFDDLWEASSLLLEASNTVVTVRWMSGWEVSK